MGKISIRINLDTTSGLVDKEYVLSVDDNIEQHIKERMSKVLDLSRTNSLKLFLNAYLQECFENLVKDKMIDKLAEELENIKE